MSSMRTDIFLIKTAGNTNLQKGKFREAIICYDEALRRTRDQGDARILLLNRCHARLQSQHYDLALADATAVINMSPNEPSEKALYRAATALYELQRWEEALDHFRNCLSLNPSNNPARTSIEQCTDRIREATTGEYDFKAMLDEAVKKHPMPTMNRATYIGPVEVRDCKIKSHGRGLFTTKAVEAGELLLCEAAFEAVFADPSPEVPVENKKRKREKDIERRKKDIEKRKKDLGMENCRTESDAENEREAQREMLWSSLDHREILAHNTLLKLHWNPSLRAAFAELYAGPEWVDKRDEETGLPLVEENFVTNRITYNNFGFPVVTHEYHWAIGHHPETIPDDLAGSRGVWIKASYINHSCYPMVRRSFIGDMMIFRAMQNIPANTELKFGYISGLEEVGERQRSLQKYGFICDCQVCEAEKDTKGRKMKQRYAILGQIVDIFEKGNVSSLKTYTDLLDALEATYVNPPSKEYRRAMIAPVTNIITGCLRSDLPHQVIDLTHRLLRALGFEFTVTNTSFQIQQWGFLLDEIVISLVELRDAYKIVNPALVDDADATAKKAYLIMCGEDVTYEQAYGPGGRRDKMQKGVTKVEQTGVKEMEAKGVEEMEELSDGVKRIDFA